MDVGLATLALLGAILGSRWCPIPKGSLDRVTQWLEKCGAVMVASTSAVVVWFAWGSLVPHAQINDEFSYRLQADIFADGHWTAPSPPIPEFFQQPHVLVVPAVASKFPPGHALLLSLGSLLGLPPLVPLLLTGLTAALLFLLAKRIENVWVGLLASLIWISTPLVVRFQPSYMSELTSGAALLSAWWCLLKWRDTRSLSWLCVLAFVVGWGAITRPLTMLALTVPIGVVVLRDVAKRRRVWDLGLALAIGIAVLAILPLWNIKTTGSWTVPPWELYRRDYLPMDRLGFSLDPSPPRRALLPPMQQLYRNILLLHQSQTLVQLPHTIFGRARRFGEALFGGTRLPLILFAAIGLDALTWPLAFAAISALVLFLAYFPYAFADSWTVYYLEITPVAATIIAVGMWRVVVRAVDGRSRERVAACLLSVVLAMMAVPLLVEARAYHSRRFDEYFEQWLARVPARRAIVFIRYQPGAHNYTNVVLNYRDLTSVPIWVVHDLGPKNTDLRRLAPDREVFEFDNGQIARGPRQQ